MRARSFLKIGLAAASAFTLFADPALEVTAVRFWSMTDSTRVAIETNGEFQFRTDRLQNPDRVFYDLLGAKPRMVEKGVRTTQVGDKLLKRIRVAETQPGITRIVLDLEEGVQVNASQLSNPDRLILELRPPRLDVPAQKPPAIPVPEVPPSTPMALPQAAAKVTAQPAVEVVPAPAPAAPVKTPVKPPLPAKRNTDGERSLVRALGLKVRRVVIDPGHGGHDQGSTGRTGLLEKDLVLDVAKRLGALIETKLGSEVIYTRADDTFIPLEARTGLANENKADLFLSLHANSSPVPSVSGVETYFLNFTTARDAMDVAARENAGSDQSVYELEGILQKIGKQDKARESRDFAARVQTALYGNSLRSNAAARNRGVKKAPFVVLIGATMPSILAEIGFVSNPREEALLKKPDYRQRIAEALFKGLSRYADSLSHFEVAQASGK
ncbi:MAG: N-acetylmuramoyl-L-alanine amidase [Bryobacterales bacterium]|nr:N-acetylmuramoyl-L-alanine amidase [Bryobacterales bacterium]